jgi:hypothetical protein
VAELSLAKARTMTSRHGVSLREAFRVWLRVAMLSFAVTTLIACSGIGIVLHLAWVLA